LQVVVGIALFGSAGIFIRLLQLPAPVFVSGQALIALVPLVALQMFGPRRKPLRIRRGLRLVFAISGVLALDQLCFTVGVSETKVATIVILAYLYPVLTAILSVKVLGEHVGPSVVIAIVVALIGTLLVLVPLGKPVGVDLKGAALGITVAVLISVYRVLIKKVDPTIPTTALAIYTTGVIGLVFAPSLALSDYVLEWRTVGLLVMSALLTSTLAGLLVLSGLRKVEAHRAAVLSYLEPVVAALLAWGFLAEQPAPQALVGTTFIVLAGYLVVRRNPTT